MLEWDKFRNSPLAVLDGPLSEEQNLLCIWKMGINKTPHSQSWFEDQMSGALSAWAPRTSQSALSNFKTTNIP